MCVVKILMISRNLFYFHSRILYYFIMIHWKRSQEDGKNYVDTGNAIWRKGKPEIPYYVREVQLPVFARQVG